MRQLIAGNWKMNGLIARAESLAAAIRQGAGDLPADLLLCPPHTVLATVGRILAGSRVMLGGQDCHEKPEGAHTGDIAAPMLRDAGAGWVILGHSERRAEHHESDARVRAKAQAARQAGLSAIICVGETESERDSGHAHARIGAQLAASLPDGFDGAVAYEPIWAIGTGRTPTAPELIETHDFIRTVLADRFGATGRAMRILYGGSVKAENAAELLALPEVGGALVGGASLDAAGFLAIARAAIPARDGEGETR